jgi:hypothetical protein
MYAASGRIEPMVVTAFTTILADEDRWPHLPSTAMSTRAGLSVRTKPGVSVPGDDI